MFDLRRRSELHFSKKYKQQILTLEEIILNSGTFIHGGTNKKTETAVRKYLVYGELVKEGVCKSSSRKCLKNTLHKN